MARQKGPSTSRFLRSQGEGKRRSLVGAAARGNLIEPLSALQALGIWPAGDFRVDANEMGLTIVFCVLAAAAALTGSAVAIRERRWDLASYLLGVPAAALGIIIVGSPWVDGKALAIVSPVILFAALVGCMWAWSERRIILGAGVAALLCLGVAWSNALAYKEVNLAPREQLAELERLGLKLEGEGPVLMTEYQPYGVRHFLRDSDAEGASELRRRPVPLADGSPLEKGLWADTDDFRADAFEPYEALVLRRSPEQSRPPGDFERGWSGEFYELWLRDAGVTTAADRLPLGGRRSPVSEPECSEVRRLARAVPGGTLLAAASEEPVFLEGASGKADFASGTYTAWLEGSVRGEAMLEIDGERVEAVRHLLNNEGLYAELGTADLEAGAHEISVEVEGSDLAPGSGGPDEHGSIAVGPGPDPESRLTSVPTADAAKLCGRPWDWIEARP